ncbi:peptidase M54 [Ignicoccus islandicus DSM 13165]|uniref:Archaemetzincin n=1 Tax=Ignicoccus islandicus DSM 13165 TaxID=940295 RepID=A0A0U3FRD0_9CREN|nr:archaemetzincin family Zn-dependent metalloprotease [Ignicoccus islandicus]ALU12032.1 peptidase M54 [Ignicoccus islandicus DSM 13165]
MTKQRVYIFRVGDVSSDLLDNAALAIKENLPFDVEVLIYPQKLQPPISTFDWERMQYVASALVFGLVSKLGIKLKPYEKAIFVVNADAYEPPLNFVFGIALPSIGSGAVFLPRLRNETYGLPPDYNALISRLRKEVLHELGHLYGLEHCPNPRCVMAFSNSINEVDAKGEEYCERCRRLLESFIEGFER